MAFDDHRPSCRSLGTLADGDLLPLPGVEPCKGWEAVVTESGPVWAEIPRPNVLDESHVYAGAPDGSVVDLGPATSGSLTWCAGATYFVRDPQSPGEPARLLRWTDAGAFEVVYETPARRPGLPRRPPVRGRPDHRVGVRRVGRPAGLGSCRVSR